MLKDKKGQVGLEQTFWIMAFLFAAGLFIVIIFYAWGQISPNLTTSINNALPANEDAINITASNNAVNTGISTFNVMFPFLILGLIVVSLIFAFYTNSTPMFFFIGIVLLLGAVTIAVVMSNVYQQVTTTSAFASAGEDFKITQLFMKNFPLIIVIIIAITMVVLYTRGNSGGATGGL